MYVQALLSLTDDIALSWFDYFCGFLILNALEQVLFPIRDTIESLMTFFLRDEAVFNTVPYIEDTISLAWIDPSVYRNPGAGTIMVMYAGIIVVVENPILDVLSAD